MPPNLSSNQYSTFLEKLNESVCLAQLYSPDNIIILGDLNAGNTFLDKKYTNHSPFTPYELNLHDELSTLNLKQLITEPTRYTPSSNGVANLRDLLIVSNDSMINGSGVLPCFSNIDHLPIYASLKIDRPPTLRYTKQLWDYRRMDPDKLTRLLMDTDWDTLLNTDLDEATNNFTYALMTAARASIPVRTTSIKANDKPWFTSELKRQIRKRDRLFKIAKKRNTDNDWDRWRRQRNLTTETNRRLKETHIQTQVEKLLLNKKDPYSYHKILKEIIGRKSNESIPPLIGQDGIPYTDDTDKATILNRHFATQTRLDIQDKPTPPIIPPESSVPPLAGVQVTESEVLKILNKLDINKSSGLDKVPAKLLKMCAIIIASPLSKLFNKSLQLGKFPSPWKKACVTPIFKKKGSNSDPTNYRPISLLPILSKILEKLVFNKMYEHISNNFLLTEKQSGYRPGHSTQIQLLYLTHHLYSTLDNNQNFTAIFLDISKYFDKIWHKGLLEKCKIQYNISGSLLEWLTSYLEDRSQIVKVGNSLSPPELIHSGCPQGSVLGPLLAIMYLNDLSSKTQNDALFYADDTSLYFPHYHDGQPEKQSIQNDLNAIKQYGDDWAITFNAQKTTQLTFTNKHDNPDFLLTFDRQDIPIATSHKHLGLTLSTDLHFHEHTKTIIRTVNAMLGPVYPVARFLSRQTLEKIYTTYIRPHFDYCDFIYDGNLTLTDAKRLQTLQNRCARLVTGALFRSSTTSLLNDLGWERLETRRLIHKILFFHRLYYNNPPLPTYLTDILTGTRHDNTGLRLRNESDISVPPTNLVSYHRSYFPSTIRQWNLLPLTLRNTISRTDFARQVWQRFGAPEPPPIHSCGTKLGNTLHTRLRIGHSILNAHRFQICHKDTPSPACSCGHPNEDTNHFILWCPLHDHHRDILFREMKLIKPDFDQLSVKNKISTLLQGKNANESQQAIIADIFQTFIIRTRRFNSSH